MTATLEDDAWRTIHRSIFCPCGLQLPDGIIGKLYRFHEGDLQHWRRKAMGGTHETTSAPARAVSQYRETILAFEHSDHAVCADRTYIYEDSWPERSCSGQYTFPWSQFVYNHSFRLRLRRAAYPKQLDGAGDLKRQRVSNTFKPISL
jgi:hypothetical protein